MVCPVLPGTEKTTQCCRFPVTRTAGLKRGEQKSLQNLTMRKVMKWYHEKCEAAGVPHRNLVKPHSFRIGGATLLIAANIPMDIIKGMGRCDGETARIYAQLTQAALADASVNMDTVDARPFLDADDGFFDRVAGISLDQADEWALAMTTDASDLGGVE